MTASNGSEHPLTPRSQLMPVSVAGADNQGLGSALVTGFAPHHPRRSSGAAQGDSTSLGGFVQALGRRWKLALFTAVPLAALTAAVVWYVTPVQYSAQALLHIQGQAPRGVFSNTEYTNDLPAFQKTTLALLKSRPVLTEALGNLGKRGLMPESPLSDRLHYLEKHLQGDHQLGPEILRLTLKGDDPVEAADTINAITTTYFAQIAKKEHDKRQARLKQLEETYATHEQDLRAKQQELKQKESQSGITDPQVATLHHQAALQMLTNAETKYQQTQFDLKRAEAELASLLTIEKNPPRAVVPEATVDEHLSRDSAVIQISARLVPLQQKIDQTLAVASRGEDEPSLQPLLGQRKSLEESLAKRRSEIRAQLEAQVLAKASEEVQGKIAQLQAQIMVLRGALNTDQAELVVRRQEAERLRQKPEVAHEGLRSDVARAEGALQKVGAEIAALRLEPTLPARVSLLEPAEVPQAPTSDRQVKMAGMAGGGVFVLVLFAIAWWEIRARRLNSPDDLRKHLGIPLVGALPSVPSHLRRNFSTADSSSVRFWQALLGESVDATRTLLLHAARTDAIRSVMITSAGASEGKTSLACHLGTSLARAGHKTVLVDCDLRCPAVHRVFSLPLGPGVREVLRGEVPVEDAVRPAPVSRLWVLPAGINGEQVGTPLTPEGMQMLITSLKDQFDFVIVDTPPVLPVADSLILGQQVDAALFTVLRDVSRVPMVEAAYRRLEQLGIRILGAVFIGADGDVYGTVYPYSAMPVG